MGHACFGFWVYVCVPFVRLSFLLHLNHIPLTSSSHTMCWNARTHTHTRTSMYSLMGICYFWFLKRRKKRNGLRLNFLRTIYLSAIKLRAVYSLIQQIWLMNAFWNLKIAKKVSQEKKRYKSEQWVSARERDRKFSEQPGQHAEFNQTHLMCSIKRICLMWCSNLAKRVRAALWQVQKPILSEDTQRTRKIANEM